MKKQMFYLVTLFIGVSCAKQSADENFPADVWNGYGKFLKSGEQVHTLWAGQNINVGQVTYGIDDEANFYVTYDCSTSGWLISETHMFAGAKSDMPVNKPGDPKVGHFPYSGIHLPWLATFTYRVPLSQLPPCESPGFVVASHCVVQGPGNQCETAWAEGDFTFSDKGWGWYDDYYYNTGSFQCTIVYAISQDCDSLKLYQLDVVNLDAELIFSEYVGNEPGTYDGAACDPESGAFLFVNRNTGQLWVNDLYSDEPSFCSGNLNGNTHNGTFFEGAYYYVDDLSGAITRVMFDADWSISSVSPLDTVPGLVTVDDMAMGPNGDYMYFIGSYNGSSTQLITWEVNTRQFYSTSIPVNEGAQISFGSDGQLYAIASGANGTGYSSIYTIDVNSGTLVAIDEEVIIIDDPFSDLAMGPLR